jgi:hypothetical protein
MDDYTYETAGLDGFLSRSIDKTPQVNLSSPGPISMSIPYDRMQVSGMIGGSIQIGNIQIKNDSIVLVNEGVTQMIIGFDQGGF